MAKKSAEIDKFAVRLRTQAPVIAMMRGLGIEAGRTIEATEEIKTLVRKAIDKGLESAEIEQEVKDEVAKDVFDTLVKNNKIKFDKNGISALDVVTLGLTTEAEVAHQFSLEEIDWNNDQDMEYLTRIFNEAIEIYNEHIRDQREKRIHKELCETDTKEGLTRIFQCETGLTEHKQLIPQACGILRIVGAIHHMECDPKLSLIPLAEEKINRILEKHFPSQRVNGKVRHYFKPNNTDARDASMELVRAEGRTKSRHRRVIKLLQKPSNLADEVMDHIGIRLLTHNPHDTIKLIYEMIYHPTKSIFSGLNMMIEETTQLMFDEETMRRAISSPENAEKLVRSLEKTTTTDHEDETEILELRDTSSSEGEENKHSAKGRRAIQITLNIALTLPSSSGKRRRVHFPLEIQIADIQSHLRNESGEGAHPKYEERQIAGKVRPRVIGNNTLTAFKKANQ